jgi:hypothetical protein
MAVISALVLGVLTPLLCIHFLAAPQPAASELKGVSVPALSPSDIMNKSTASQYGIRGYLLITWQDAPQELSLNRGESWNGTLSLQFVSYDDSLTELHVYADPKGHYGVRANACYRSEDGSVQAFDVSSVLSYSPSGIVTIKAAETLPIAVTLQLPADFPGTLVSFPLKAVGIAPVEKGIPTVNGPAFAGNGEVTVK